MPSLLKRQVLITPQIQRFRELGRKYPRRMIENFIKVDDDMGNAVPMKYTWAQNQYDRLIQEEMDKGNPVRLWITKWRRATVTSIGAARGFARAYCYDNARVGIIAHEEDRAKEILQKMNFFYDSMAPELQLQKSKDNIFGIKFESVNGQVLIGTANNPMKIRGDGLHWIDCTEAPHYEYNFLRVNQEVCPVVPDKPNTGIIYEGTGSLRGCAAHAHAMAAKAGDNEFRYHFLNWRDSPDCRVPFESLRQKEEIFALMRDTEPRLLDKVRFYKMDDEQAHQMWRWYRWKGTNDFDYFSREFPCSEDEVWSAGGASFFGNHEVNTISCQAPMACYQLESNYINSLFNSFDELKEVDSVPMYGIFPVIQVWSPPRTGGKYVIGVDSALGEAYGDYTAAYVVDIATREMLASFHGRVRPDETAHIMVSLARMYNNALLAPECNTGGGGLTILQDIQRIGYFNMYQWRKRDHIEGLRRSNSLGWWTTPRSRPIMLGELRKVFLDCVHGRLPGENIFRDRHLIDEMRTFAPDPNNPAVPHAMPGCYDDRVFALGIAHQAAMDEAYCTGADLMHSYHKFQGVVPSNQKKLVQKVKPSNVMSVMMGKNSPFNKKGFEMQNGRINGWPSM